MDPSSLANSLVCVCLEVAALADAGFPLLGFGVTRALLVPTCADRLFGDPPLDESVSDSELDESGCPRPCDERERKVSPGRRIALRVVSCLLGARTRDSPELASWVAIKLCPAWIMWRSAGNY